jgi:ferredoxin-NADP reductase
MNYTAKLTGRKLIAEETMAFLFEKPEGFEFHAGQFCLLSLPDIGFQDEKGLRRPLSIASSPFDNDLMFVAKMSGSAFKKTLREMPAGTAVTIDGPHGSFILPEDTSIPVVFIAGGIAIIPFRSMVLYVAEASTKHTITLFYSSRTPQEAAFLKELQDMAKTHRNIRLVATMTRVPEQSEAWSGLTGRINPAIIMDNCKEWQDALYYVSGSSGMVDGIRSMLTGMKIKKERIRKEKFTGY